MPHSESAESIDIRLRKLRAGISDLGHQIDSYKAKTAGAFGAGVFLFLLAAGAVYDLIAGRSAVWLARGATRETIPWIASGLGAASIVLLVLALARIKRRDTALDGKLEQMEKEYAELLESRDAKNQPS